jgi:uncharacterized protein (DUF1810 family)
LAEPIPGTDSFNLQRFVDAQQPMVAEVAAELQGGRKTGHWMWFFFPQIQGLGHSPTARAFSIASLDEARAYIGHPVLGPRLREFTRLVNAIPDASIEQILGHVDGRKFQSCMTLFSSTTADNRVFLDALEKYFGSAKDLATLERI